ncbi:hypothetical protein SteCoe_1525 [Stentor coeruleus]|uniref:PWWP domain-containing protein n=1 Tax=Stentor coeruleus TaxID=5963 RepID=A0A1R2D1N8_9CILI|nr:hypothetical protein SteCoe_1525 [Stentor coeruleus]
MVEKTKVVWAKLIGYPWWPGIEESYYMKGNKGYKRIRFITDDTHSDIQEQFVKDFRLYYNKFKNGSKSTVYFTQTFLKDLCFANEIMLRLKETPPHEDPPSPTCSDSESTSEIKQATSVTITKTVRNYTNLLQQLKDQIFADENSIKKPTCKGTVLMLKKKLCKSIMDMDLESITEVLIELESLEITKEILESTKLMKLLSYFIKSYNISVNINQKKLVELTKCIYYKWKKFMICLELQGANMRKEGVKDPELREKVCRRIIDILVNNGFEKKESEALAVSIENNIRKRDPDMKDAYIKFTRKMIRDIKLLDKISYARMLKNSVST